MFTGMKCFMFKGIKCFMFNTGIKFFICLQELSRVNTEAACVCLTSLIESLESVDKTKWLESISQDVAKLKNFVAVLQNKAVSFMTFLNIMVSRTVIIGL